MWAKLRRPLEGIAEGLTRNLAAASARLRPAYRATSSPRNPRCRSSRPLVETATAYPRDAR